jgi:hypothetical protein
MKRTPIIAIVIAACVAVIVTQFIRNGDLADKVEQLNQQVVELSGDTRQGASGLSGNGAGKKIGTEEGRKPEAKDNQEDVPGATLRQILANPDPLTRIEMLLAYVKGISKEDIPDALFALQESAPEWDPHMRMAVDLLLTRWGTMDAEGALAYTQNMKNRKRAGQASMQVLRVLASQDPEKAKAWLTTLTDNPEAKNGWMGHFYAGTVATEWVRQDPEAALAWANSLPESQRRGALGGALETIAATNPVQAAEFAMDLDPGKERSEVIGKIAESWAESAPKEAMEWAMTLPGEDGESAIRQAISGWAEIDAAAAAAFVDAIPVAERSDSHIREVANRWANQEPAAAAQWLDSQPDGRGKTDAMGHVVWNWTNADPQAASTWLIEQPAGEARDRGIGALAKATFDSDPAAAVIWAAEISNEQTRTASLERGVRGWLERDPEAARQWLNSTDVISAEEVQKFQEAPRRERDK